MKKQDIINKLNDMSVDYRTEGNNIIVEYRTSEYFGESNVAGYEFMEWLYYDMDMEPAEGTSYGYEVYHFEGFDVIGYDEAADE